MWEKLKNDLAKEQKRRLKDKEQQEQGQAAWQAAKARFKKKPYYCTVYVTGSGVKKAVK